MFCEFVSGFLEWGRTPNSLTAYDGYIYRVFTC